MVLNVTQIIKGTSAENLTFSYVLLEKGMMDNYCILYLFYVRFDTLRKLETVHGREPEYSVAFSPHKRPFFRGEC